ncbi:hypothetical protein [Clostridium saccharoperbutylacetonicum]|uniref:hypothetical protein n=1 Tax=Clostridium saccharoperbutylacetonicum TaxID=36745 RepID=UPI0039ECF3E8
MLNLDTIDSLALEILRNKCDLKSSSVSEILNCYFNIYKELKELNSKLPKVKINSGTNVLK